MLYSPGLVLVLGLVTRGCLGERPNIVTIIADDMGWNDAGFHGSNQIPTPNIDALAYNGVILHRHYTMPTCTPSRTAYLTGRYPIRTGMQGHPLKAGEPRGLPLEIPTLPQKLQELGYVTRIIGKWHQGSHRTEFIPTHRGFDSFLGYWNGYIGYFDYTLNENGLEGLDFHRDNCSSKEFVGQYATDAFTDEAVGIIKNHDVDRPLYLHFAHLAVHTGNDDNPLEVPNVQEALDKFSYIGSKERSLYAEMVSKLDESVGRVVRALSEKGILNNTILIFISDNGAQTIGTHSNWGSNWPLRGLKFTLFEGGTRGLAAVWSPDLRSPGRVTDQLVHLTDWLPTLYFAAGGNVSDLGLLDGVNQWPSIVSEQGSVKGPRHQILVNIDAVQDMEAAINGRWKVVRGEYKNGIYDGYYGDDGQDPQNPSYNISAILTSEVNRALQITHRDLYTPTFDINEHLIRDLRSKSTVHCDSQLDQENNIHIMPCVQECLFDLTTDPCEMNDVSAKHPEKVQELKAVLDQYREVTVPQLNKPVDPLSYPSLHNELWVSWMDDTDPNVQECLITQRHMKVAATGCQFCTTIILIISTMLLCLYWPRNYQ